MTSIQGHQHSHLLTLLSTLPLPPLCSDSHLHAYSQTNNSQTISPSISQTNSQTISPAISQTDPQTNPQTQTTLQTQSQTSALPALSLLIAQISSETSRDTKLRSSDDFLQSLERLVSELRSSDNSLPFHRPVKKSEAPDYYAVISTPMDFQTLSKKIKLRAYTHKASFRRDLNRVWDNCLAYNTDPSHPIRRHAVLLREKADHLLAHIPEPGGKSTVPTAAAAAAAAVHAPAPVRQPPAAAAAATAFGQRAAIQRVPGKGWEFGQAFDSDWAEVRAGRVPTEELLRVAVPDLVGWSSVCCEGIRNAPSKAGKAGEAIKAGEAGKASKKRKLSRQTAAISNTHPHSTPHATCSNTPHCISTSAIDLLTAHAFRSRLKLLQQTSMTSSPSLPSTSSLFRPPSPSLPPHDRPSFRDKPSATYKDSTPVQILRRIALASLAEHGFQSAADGALLDILAGVLRQFVISKGRKLRRLLDAPKREEWTRTVSKPLVSCFHRLLSADTEITQKILLNVLQPHSPPILRDHVSLQLKRQRWSASVKRQIISEYSRELTAVCEALDPGMDDGPSVREEDDWGKLLFTVFSGQELSGVNFGISETIPEVLLPAFTGEFTRPKIESSEIVNEGSETFISKECEIVQCLKEQFQNIFQDTTIYSSQDSQNDTQMEPCLSLKEDSPMNLRVAADGRIIAGAATEGIARFQSKASVGVPKQSEDIEHNEDDIVEEDLDAEDADGDLEEETKEPFRSCNGR